MTPDIVPALQPVPPTTSDAVMARCFILGMVAVIGCAALLTGGPVVPVLALAGGFALAGCLAARIAPGAEAVLVAIALAGQGMVFTAVFTGHPWQVDSHMMFFAILAIAATLQSVPALVAAAGVIAVHHLSLGLLMPALIYPSSNLVENLERTALHAMVVVMETTFLGLAIVSRARQKAAADRSHRVALEAADAARAALAEADSLRAHADEVGRAAREMTGELGRNLAAMAARDLTGRIGTGGPADYADLARDYDCAIDLLSVALGETLELMVDMQTEAASAAQMTEGMAVHLERQAADVSQTATAIRDLTGSLEQTAEGIHQVRSGAEMASRKATEGGEIVRAANAAMLDIQSASMQIENIIQVIEEISFQTNLLALNAGVEAARAGSAGAGFAVVASEVRALSHRTSEAANQVKALISDSVGKVAEGAALVDRAGSALVEIEAAVADATGQVSGLSQVAADQSTALRTMAGNVDTIDNAIQAYAAQTEQMSAMSARIAQDAEALHRRLGGFRLGHTAATGPRGARAA